MIIHLYTRCWNDAHMLPFFFKHYDSWVDRYYIYDDGSDDGSIDLLRAHPRVVIRSQPPLSDPQSRVESQRRLQNEIWKESRGQADWVVLTDLDEHLYHPEILPYLEECRNNSVTVIPALGFEMISKSFPSHAEETLFDICTTGAPSRSCTKVGIFNPDKISETNFAHGRHRGKLSGLVLAPKTDQLLLFHFHYLDFDRVVSRHKRYLARQRSKDIENNWGIQYTWSDATLREKWADIERSAVDVRLGHWDGSNHPGADVWRKLPRTRWRQFLRFLGIRI